jgi:steroid 5-alpha reductase family enzyme
MSLASERESWVDRWWPLLLILFGVIFVACLVSFNPAI